MTAINSELIIHPNIIRKNINFLKSKINKTSKFMAVIKSDAYGHDLQNIIKDIDDIVDGYGVVRIDEAIKIRKYSDKKVLLMQGVYNQDEFLVSKDYKLDLVVHNLFQFKIIKNNDHYHGIWIKVNTGMNRLGFDIKEFLNIYKKYLFNKNFILMSHLAAAEDAHNKKNIEQFNAFEEIIKCLRPSIQKSIANTGCILNFPEKSYDWVRCGIGMYGGNSKDEKELETAMQLRSPIVNLRNIKKGETVGYDARAVAKKNMKIATVYIGYADGLPSNLRDGSKVLVKNKIAKIFGKVSMDSITIDVSNFNDISVGDWCTFFSAELPINDISKFNDLISHFFMTNIQSRVKKVYKSLS
ncbi:MAG: alanine racemase [Gammaproteobacteria bacterium]|nr:alanine racemase [Gammaproteobacteria bacterium]|tara:strand:- start:233 stop:1297 length:1065 start_codon:yes stop_codon:yes gene_type:complete